MDTGSYPPPSVSRFIEQEFVPARVNLISGDPSQAAGFHVLWTPCFLVLEGERECYRNYGFLPAEDLSALLRIALGMRALGLGRYDEAAAWHHEAADGFSQSPFRPQALYWEGVARYKQSGDFTAARDIWERLAREAPASTWARRASFALRPHEAVSQTATNPDNQ